MAPTEDPGQLGGWITTQPIRAAVAADWGACICTLPRVGGEVSRPCSVQAAMSRQTRTFQDL